MLSPAEKLVLAEFKRALSGRFGDRLAEVLLFGSRARGTGRDDSDLDVAVVVTDLSAAERTAVLDVAADLSVEHGLVLSPLVRAASRPASTVIEGIIAREGIRQ